MMPPGYQTRFAEIQRLSEELQGIDRIARLIWETGPTLQEAVRDAFTSLKFDVEFTPETAPQVIVKLDGKRRLLLHVRSADGAIDKKTPELSQAFQSLQETSGSDDRVVLAANAHPTEAEICAALDGNICRCGTHARILRAIKKAAAALP